MKPDGTVIERALVAVDIRGAASVMATDGGTIGFDTSEISSSCEDIGIPDPEGRGLFLWTGTAKVVTYQTPDGNYEPELEYAGAYRPVRPEEIAELLAMVPPSDEAQEIADGSPVH